MLVSATNVTVVLTCSTDNGVKISVAVAVCVGIVYARREEQNGSKDEAEIAELAA